jgi:hypothetical protein
MTFDDNATPRRAKPVLGAGRTAQVKGAAESKSTTSGISEGIVQPTGVGAKTEERVTPVFVSSPAVGFTVEDKEVTSEPVCCFTCT